MNLLKGVVEVINVSIYSISIDKSIVPLYFVSILLVISDSTLILYSSANFSNFKLM